MRKRKVFQLLLSVGTLTCCFFGFTACETSKEPHTHVYDQQTVREEYLSSSATCTEKAVYYTSCSCGEHGEETFEDGEPLGHTGGEATCKEKAVCTRCENAYGEYANHNFDEEWSVNDEKHWRECVTSECNERAEEQIHTYTNGSCICGKQEPIFDTHSVTAKEWSDSFAFENVTVENYRLVENQKILTMEILLDGENGLLIVDGMKVPMDGYAAAMRLTYNFSSCYATATYADGKYAVERFDVYGDGSYVYENALLSFDNGKLLGIEATVKEEVVEYDDDFNEIGTTTETYSAVIEFKDYGTTELTYQNGPLTQAEWESAFADDKFTDVVISVTDEEGTSTIWHDGAKEKFSTTSVPTAALYLVDGIWYWYGTVVVENSVTHYERSDFTSDLPYDSFVAAFDQMFALLKFSYTTMTYDTESGEYQWFDENGGFSVKIENGKLTSITQTFITQEGTTTKLWQFSNYGATTVSVPFTPSVSCTCQVCQANATNG